MSIELGSWMLPMGITIAAFGLAFATVSAGDTPVYGRLTNLLFNALLLSMAAIASLSTWLAWSMVGQ